MSDRFPPRVSFLMRIALWTLILCSAQSLCAVEIVPWELRGYRVRIELNMPSDVARADGGFAPRIQQLVEREFGNWWHVETNVHSLRTFQGENSPANAVGAEFDKRFTVDIQPQGSQWLVTVDEWDGTLASWSGERSRVVIDQRELVANVADLVAAAFRPVAEVTSSQAGHVTLNLRGGEFIPASWKILQGDLQHQPKIFVPEVHNLDKQGKIKARQKLAFTYLRVQEVDRSFLECAVYSAFRTPLPAARRRTAVLAVLAEPSRLETEVEIVPRRRTGAPLGGCRVEIDPFSTGEERKSAPADAAGPTIVESPPGRISDYADRNGIVTVASPVAEAERLASPLKNLTVYSGSQVLVRVPILPGFERRLRLEVPDDAERLSAEGELTVLEGELITIVARREVGLARCRRAIDAETLDEARAFLDDVKKLPSAASFQKRIADLRVIGEQAARNGKDRVAEARIHKLCERLETLIAHHLDSDRIKALEPEVLEQRNAPQTKPKAAEKPEKNGGK